LDDLASFGPPQPADLAGRAGGSKFVGPFAWSAHAGSRFYPCVARNRPGRVAEERRGASRLGARKVSIGWR